eukprot:COSAG02_NODE_36_length_48934_cov_144.851029_7_plen_76_part_00
MDVSLYKTHCESAARARWLSGFVAISTVAMHGHRRNVRRQHASTPVVWSRLLPRRRGRRSALRVQVSICSELAKD